MDSPAHFRGALRRRLLMVIGPALLAGPLACAPTIVDSRSEGGGGQGGSKTRSLSTGGDNGGGGMAGACTLTSTGISSGTAVMAANQLTECITTPASGCPNEYDAPMFIAPSQACSAIRSVDCGPVKKDGSCCYLVTEEFVGCAGRPFIVRGVARLARLTRGAGVEGWSGALAPPALSSLTRGARTALSEAWANDALAEHASVASFSRFALQLMAVGAPADLVAGAHQAALEEVRHAALGFALASAYAGKDLGPGPFPIDKAAFARTTLVDLARATAREGCIGETVSALVVAEQLEHATDPAVRAALEEIAADEARHAELAWRTVAWALEVGGDEVRGALTEVLRDAARYAPEAGDPLAPGFAGSKTLAAHGRLDRRAGRLAAERALGEVVRPCAARLLGRAAALASA